jgi:uncharacterized protein YjiS (DUF1127 family)
MEVFMENASELKKIQQLLNRLKNKNDFTVKSKLNAFKKSMIYVLERVSIWERRINGRKELAKMNGMNLQDIGITKVDVQKECRKHFWEK